MIRRVVSLDLYYPATEVPVHAEVSVYPWTTKRGRKKKAEALKGTWLKYKHGCTQAVFRDGRGWSYHYTNPQDGYCAILLPVEIDTAMVR